MKQTQSLAAIRHVEMAVSNLVDLQGVALRYGSFYGPGTGMFEPAVVDQLRKRQFPLIDGGGGWWNFIHVDDAASATVAAIEGDAVGLYNVVDDERRRFASGCRRSPGRSARSRRGGCPSGSRASSPARRW
jgi:nucleoside-diphosphate-sugar epimerase